MAIIWEKKGTIFNIQRFSLHDGPGIRTIIFLKGCPLRCKWCCNPESQNPKKQLLFEKDNCIQCHKCVEVCPTGAVKFEEEIKINYSKCTGCEKCTEVCYADALQMMGREMTVKEIYDDIKKDEVYFRHSKGGVTLSGGEALYQSDFALELLKAVKNGGWNTSIETTAFVSKDILNKILPYVDLVLLDLKVVNSSVHEAYTGQNNAVILENARYMANMGQNLIIRMPIVPGVNDTKENIHKTILFMQEIGVHEIHLLPYHRLGVNKYEYLGYQYTLNNQAVPNKESMDTLKSIFEEEGIRCKIGG